MKPARRAKNRGRVPTVRAVISAPFDLHARVLDPRTPDDQPQHEDQLPEERVLGDTHVDVGEQERSQRVRQITQAADDQQRPQYPGDIARPENQVAEEAEMNAEEEDAA